MLRSKLLARLGLALATLVLWALAAGSAAFWGLKLWATPRAASAPPVALGEGAALDSAAVAKALGAQRALAPTVMAVSSRYNLIGVAAVSAGGKRGVALISVDNKPARPYRVGAALEDGVLLQSVEAQRATLGASLDGPALAVLELPLKK